jgi:putative protein-disulfide isomerase
MTQATLHYIHDPLCGWCYATQPLISAAMQRLGGRLALQLHGGGLFPEPRVLDKALTGHIAQSDQRIAQYSKQPFGKPYLEGLLAEQGTVLYSMPPIAAVLAAADVDATQAYPLLVEIQNAHYQRGLRVVEPPVLGELAEEIGLDGARFALAFAQANGHELMEHVQASRRLLDSVGGKGFPTLLLELQGEPRVFDHSRYYGQPQAFVEALTAALPALH